MTRTDGNKNDKAFEGNAEQLYGPYPSAVPIPDTGDNSVQSLIDHRDLGTPDQWIQRDGRLVRLTGRHPFNVEPPLTLLNEFKFLTPASLHYTRNHGAVPKLSWETHRIAIGGNACPYPFTIGMDELSAVVDGRHVRELPVTLVCAGNRRKEQNMIRQSVGFGWGAAGASTNVWKGVRLSYLLQKAGLSIDDCSGNKFVEFVGYEDLPNKVGKGPFSDDPWGATVKYGTCVPFGRAMNPAFDIIVAYEQNGERIKPDHGFPCRVIIPGYIGGRMVKWLAQINVITHETHNLYHYHDNRILPPHIQEAESLKDGWWYKPDYIFNEYCINSVITQPNHNECLSISKAIETEYTMAGYAFSGGGRKITRVEVSMDGGVDWELADIERKERPNNFGMHWCWVWWTFRLPVADLVGTKQLMVRAWDASNNTQPMYPTWNLMGMGNNQVFRVEVHIDLNDAGEHVFRFDHPTQPGAEKGGWMEDAADKPKAAGFGLLSHFISHEPEQKVVSSPAPDKQFAWPEIESHNMEGDAWIVIGDRVYDTSKYLSEHPGGVDSILLNAGNDATEDFEAIHSAKAHKLLERFCIGTVDTNTTRSAEGDKQEELVDEEGRKMALNPKRKIPLKLQSKSHISSDSFALDFALPGPDYVLGLPAGKHIFFYAEIDGSTVVRAYTPISCNLDLGHVTFVIKAYHSSDKYPKGGKMSQYLEHLEVGDTIEMRGPTGEFAYAGNGQLQISGETFSVKRFNMIAAGSGITPPYQMLHEIFASGDMSVQATLVFSARYEEDLLCKKEVDEFAMKHPNQFKVTYVLSKPDEHWKGSSGHIDDSICKDHLSPPADDVFNVMCGPPGLTKATESILKKLGHHEGHIFTF